MVTTMYNILYSGAFDLYSNHNFNLLVQIIISILMYAMYCALWCRKSMNIITGMSVDNDFPHNLSAIIIIIFLDTPN